MFLMGYKRKRGWMVVAKCIVNIESFSKVTLLFGIIAQLRDTVAATNLSIGIGEQPQN